MFGPDNGITYWYQVASRDTLDRAGAWSAAVSATPVRSLPPMAPDDLQVSPTTSADGLVVTWRKVTRNVENHRLPDLSQTNYVYRATTREALEDLAALPGHLVATITSNPQDLTTPVLSWTDTDPALVPPYGTTPFFYRVRVADPFGNLSAPSAVITGTVPDTTPPGPTDLDHCHKTGRVRFLLCRHGNRGLGAFFDSPNLMRRAARVLEQSWEE